MTGDRSPRDRRPVAEAGGDRSAATGRPVAGGVATGLADWSPVPVAGGGGPATGARRPVRRPFHFLVTVPTLYHRFLVR